MKYWSVNMGFCFSDRELTLVLASGPAILVLAMLSTLPGLSVVKRMGLVAGVIELDSRLAGDVFREIG